MENELLWFQEGITNLYRKGVKDPIYMILDALKQDNAKTKELQRCIEFAISDMVNRFNEKQKTAFKQRLADAIHGHITVTFFKGQLIPITYDDWSDCYSYHHVLSKQTFRTEQDATVFIAQTLTDLKIKHQLEDCREMVKQSAFVMIYETDEKDKYKLTINRDHLFY